MAAFNVAATDADRTNATVFVVDDDNDVRFAVTMLVRSVGLFVEAYPSAQEFLDRYDGGKPGCLVADIRMPGMSGLELQKTLRASGIGLPVIFVTAHGEIPLATAAMRAGAVDFIPKPFSPQSLLERIQEAIDLDLGRRQRVDQAHEVEKLISRLTEREREVMQLLAEGLSTKLVALRLSISPKTVDNHRTKILEKMKVDNATQLARVMSLLQ